MLKCRWTKQMNRNKAYLDILEEQIEKMVKSGVEYARLVQRDLKSDRFGSRSFL
jgi:hypothetical protein